MREARPFLLILGVLTLAFAFFACWSAILPALLFVYVLYFFRDPERTPPGDPLAIVSAADGKVIAVDEVAEDAFTRTKMKRVAVFLSVFDVHVNRAPYAGTVKKRHHHAGEFLDARLPEVDVKNEAMNWLLETARGSLVLRQIAGLIARRIVAWRNEGDVLQTGERFGMIRFGSRTDVFLPLDCEIKVKIGDRVKGGESVIARWKQ
ncbi:MAG: phosphatidylserine decarboxylase family protein [Methylacidiphilales bacterium]|nr:phosphatidylserine decarboxylase family protein [Candidatus Methylacidiphilales bacterium]